MRAGRDLLKSVWEVTEAKQSRWKIEHPSDTEDEKNVGLSSEDEAEGLEAAPGVARRGTGVPTVPEPQPAPAPAPLRVADDKIVMKKRALRRMKQQMSALLRGEDLPEGAQGREVAEVPYEVPEVPRGETTCPVCGQSFRSHHRVVVHMGVHRGEKFPCGKCGKVLASKRYWRDHTQSCVKGKTVACPVCRKPFASAQSMHNHHKAQHGADSLVPPGGFECPFCGKKYQIKKNMDRAQAVLCR